MDIQKQIKYWRDGAHEDLDAATDLLEKNRLRHALFFAELAVEKMLKAHVSKVTREVPPKIHDLLRLADLAKMPLSAEQREFLARFQAYCLEGRYPEIPPAAPPRQLAEAEMERCREVVRWLTDLLT